MLTPAAAASPSATPSPDAAGARVCILDYGSGNVQSVLNLVAQLTPHVRVSNAEADIAAASHLILPGVGAFGASMASIIATLPLGLIEREVLEGGKPFLGICVGLQVMADIGLEFGEHRGLGWLPGTVRQREVGALTLPHIGWNNLAVRQAHPLLEGLDGHDFYFVHSYAYGADTDPALVLAECSYGQAFPAVLGRGHLLGVQFHPEKSQSAGRRLLQNFLALPAPQVV